MPHCVIADGVHTMLFSANLKPNCLPHGNHAALALELSTDHHPSLSLLQVFGCHIHALPAESRGVKVNVHVHPGIFLGCQKVHATCYYKDLETGEIKTAHHIAFHEGTNNVKMPPPPACFLKGNPEPELVHLDDATQDMQMSLPLSTKSILLTVISTPCNPNPWVSRLRVAPVFSKHMSVPSTDPLVLMMPWLPLTNILVVLFLRWETLYFHPQWCFGCHLFLWQPALSP